MKWWLHYCPRCGGDLYEDVYSKGEDFVCLQCGVVLCREALFGHSLGSVHTDGRSPADMPRSRLATVAER